MIIRRNVGGIDRVFRGGISSLMVYFGFFNKAVIVDTVAGTILGIYGVIILLTAVFSSCPFYSFIGFNTYHLPDKK